MNVIFFNHKIQECGVYQYGKRLAGILAKSNKAKVLYFQVNSMHEYREVVDSHSPDLIIYNYHPSTMGWLNPSILNDRIVQCGIFHEGGIPSGLDVVFTTLPRPIFEFINNYPPNEVPVINSFGFGFANKGFQRVVSKVCEEFDEAIVNLHMPDAYFSGGQNVSYAIEASCRALLRNKVTLNVTRNFLTDDELLHFLAKGTVNAFFYDDMPSRGYASVIDYAISVKRPIAITKTFMFRHIFEANPSICVENSSLRQIISNGFSALTPYWESWSHENTIRNYESKFMTAVNKKFRANLINKLVDS